MTAVLDPDALTGFHSGPIHYSTEDGRFYVLTDDGAIPADGPRDATTLDADLLAMVGADHFTLRDGQLDMIRPASPNTAAYEDTMIGLHYPGGLSLMNASGTSRLRNRLVLNFLSGGSLDPRITFTRASSATRVNSSGLIETVSSDVARFDYDPVTLAAKGLLIEEQRTNLLTYSNDLSNVSWVKANITIGAAITGPDGAASLAKVEATTTAATVVNKTAVAAGSTSGNTFSVHAKKGSGATEANSFVLRNNTTATNLISLTINYDTGALTYLTGSGPATAINCGNGIWRIPLTATAGISAGDNIAVYPGFIGGTATAGVHAYIGFAQLEAGGFATSHIPTTSATVTRAADEASITGTNFSDWFNPAEGTFVAEADSFADVSTIVRNQVAASNAAATDRVNVFLYNGKWGGSVRVGGVDQCDLLQESSYTAGVVAKTALAYKANDFACSVNGNTPIPDASGAIPTVDRLFIGSVNGSWGHINGHIRRLTYYPARLSNALLQTLST